jgi:hypothetical protein
MDVRLDIFPRRFFAYDPVRRRVWIAGQRCHHGATGTLLAAASLTGLAAARARGAVLLGVAAGGLLMAHDWKDRAWWFHPGREPLGH